MFETVGACTRFREALAEQRRAQVGLTVAAVAWVRAQAWLLDGARSAVTWLVARTGMHAIDARRLIARARVIDRLDLVDALDSGDVSVGQADVLAALIGADPSVMDLAAEQRSLLVELCKLDHLADFDRAVRHWRAAADDALGSGEPEQRYARRGFSSHRNLFGELAFSGLADVESADVIEATLAHCATPDPAEVARTPAQRDLDTLVDVCRHALDCDDVEDTAGSKGRGEPVVIIDAYGRVEYQGHPMGPTFAERITCHARFTRAWRDEVTTRMNFGITRRDPTPAQRRAVIVRDRHCRFPGCRIDHPRCHVHHLRHREHGGATDLDNLTLLCRWHHRLVHEGGWTLHGSPSTGLGARGPTGRVVHDVSTT